MNKQLLSAGIILWVTALPILAANTDNLYMLGPDSMKHDNVPHGKVDGPTTLPSNVYPNTFRNYWVYVPAQYDAAKPACLMIFFDGHAYVNVEGEYRIPNVFDNLIHRREMPVTISVFINPGHRPDQQESSDANWGDSINNRGVEYNEVNERIGKMICDELLPLLNKKYNISPNPEDHAISGASSGAIAAFTVAWFRPDMFHKVISTIGSFTAIRGGDAYPQMIRDNDPKPIRIFLQDGLNDQATRSANTPPGRDWHGQNIRMVQALTAKHYDVNYVWGIGTHSNKQGGAIMPEMLMWLWRDYPRVDDLTAPAIDRQPLGEGGKPVQIDAPARGGRGGAGARGRGAAAPSTTPTAQPARSASASQ